MDVSRVRFGLVFFLSLVPLWNCFAFNGFTHEQITRDALAYLKTHEHAVPETNAWLSALGPEEGFMEEALIRAVVDADYKTDLWLTGWFHHPFTGGSSNGGFTIFTGMFHYLNVTVKGDYWDYDGYAYRHGSHDNNDAYLATPSATVKGSYSSALGGSHVPNPGHGVQLGPYKLGFKGNDHDWHELFYGNNDADDAVFPPASVPAQLAFDALLKTPRTTSDFTESWNEILPIVTGLFSTGHLSRHYWRGEVNGLPKGFDLLGLVMHMAQDVNVPQHAEGTADWCHQELEDLADRLACGIPKNPDTKPYQDGSFGGAPRPQCDRLYDSQLVGDILKEMQFLDPKKEMSVTERLRSIAFMSARWQWGDPDYSTDFVGTVLPDGSRYSADRCSDLIQEPAVQKQLKYQYNFAIAASVSMFEYTARKYESRHSMLRFLPLKIFNLFKLY